MNTNSQFNPRIVVVYGGLGLEREVSLVSGSAILKELEEHQDIDFVGIDLREPEVPASIQGNRDVVLLALHGEFGEDGEVQALLQKQGIQFTGCDQTSSRRCMNKDATKQCWVSHNLPVVPGFVFEKEKFSGPDSTQYLNQAIQKYGDQWVAKPSSMGSSVGLEFLSGRSEIDRFCNRDHDQLKPFDYIIEKRIKGREFSVGVLGGQAMGVVEIIVPEGRAYDYEQKYNRSDTRYECPAQLSEHESSTVKTLAEKAYRACECRDYARVDFLYDTSEAQFYCLEINTLPGMTPTSLLPKSASAIDLNFGQLIRAMIKPAIERFHAVDNN